MKIFLSHSSADKDIVGRVYESLGAAICHYDVATFDPNGFLPDEIQTALFESDYFILFASKSALESPWVKGEMRNAFLSWMKAGLKEVMVFLMRDGTLDQVPSWLKAYVSIEHPSPAHIVCRIKGKIAAAERANGTTAPFYRYEDLTRLEQLVAVPAERMPKAIMLCAADGYGKKQLINELYGRHFPSVAKFKISISLEESASEFDLYRSVLGSFSLLTLSELSTKMREFENCTEGERFEKLASEIVRACNGRQTMLIEAKDTLLNEKGELIAWMEALIRALPSAPYPQLILLSSRKPTYIAGSVVSHMVVAQLRPLPAEMSKLLFQWWLRKLDVEQVDFVMSQLLEFIEGNQKQIELAARLVANLDIPKGLVANKHRIFADLEKQASELLIDLKKDVRKTEILAFIAECGYVSEADLLSTLDGIDGMSVDEISSSLRDLISYGFVIDDEVSLRLPPFLVRAARRLSEDSRVSEDIGRAWAKFATLFSNFSADAPSSLAILNEACIASLRSGSNRLQWMDNVVLPSQCFRIARLYYDKNDHEKALALCKHAYERRIALTDESAIEVLRIQGLSAARLNDQTEFSNVIDCFKEYSNGVKPKRIRAFLLGFEARLAGKFDDAIVQMKEAYASHGSGDFHILRELAFLCWAQDEFELANSYIKRVPPIALSNHFVLEIRVRIALALGEGYVIHHQEEILSMIEELEKLETGSRQTAFVAKVEYALALKRTDEARSLLETYEKEMTWTSQAVRIVKLRVMLACGRYGVARDLGLKIKQEIDAESRKQRQSALPIVARLLIEAAAGVSISDGIEEYRRNLRSLPNVIQAKMKKELFETAAFAGHKLTSEQKRILGVT